MNTLVHLSLLKCNDWSIAVTEYFEYGGIKLPIRRVEDIDVEVRHLIPPRQDYILENPNIPQILYAINESKNILLTGEPGTGKSEFVLHLASMTNTPVVQVQNDGDMAVTDIVGGFLYKPNEGTVWQDGVVTFALKHKCWILYDEINTVLPEILARNHSLMDRRRHLDLREVGQVIKREPETVIWGTINPSDDGRHVGTKPLSPAIRSRFNLIVTWGFLSPENEIKLLRERVGINWEQAETIVKVATKAREAFDQDEMTEVIDTRMLLEWADQAKTFGLRAGAQCTILSRLDDINHEALRAILIAFGIEEAKTAKTKQELITV